MVTERLDLNKFDVSVERGFLPSRDPPRELPKECLSLEQAMHEMPARLAAGSWGPAFEEIDMPKIDPHMYSPRKKEAIFRDLCFATAGYIWERWREEKPRLLIKANIAVPLVAFAEALDCPPTLAYRSYGPHNYYRLRQDRPITYDNLGLIRTFYGGLDESGFILPHVEIEVRAGEVIESSVRTKEAVSREEVIRCGIELRKMFAALCPVVATLTALPGNCDPYIYKERVRPFIFGTKEHSNAEIRKGIVYEGVKKYDARPQAFRGETGAQSVIFPLLDAIMGIVHDETDVLSVHLREMRGYMPVKHRALLELMEKGMNVRDFVLKHPELIEVYNACIEQMVAFREQHYKFAKAYIFNQPSKRGEHVNPSNVGTGGTPFDVSLLRHIEDTRDALIRKAA